MWREQLYEANSFPSFLLQVTPEGKKSRSWKRPGRTFLGWYWRTQAKPTLVHLEDNPGEVLGWQQLPSLCLQSSKRHLGFCSLDYHTEMGRARSLMWPLGTRKHHPNIQSVQLRSHMFKYNSFYPGVPLAFKKYRFFFFFFFFFAWG